MTTLALPFILTYVITSSAAMTAARSKSGGLRKPITLPYSIPYIGHAIQFLSDGRRVLDDGANYFGSGVPFRVRMAIQDIYLVTGPELVSAFYKATRETASEWVTIEAMEFAFGTPKKAIALYKSDDSGLHANPRQGAITKPEDRIFYAIHSMVNTYLSGQSLTGMTTRFQQNLAEIVSHNNEIGDAWVEIPDLYAFLQVQVLEAAVRSIFGDYILSLNPTFIQDFWTWSHWTRDLFMKFPRWMRPDAYRTRDKMVESIKRWHKFALENYDISKASADDVEWEPYFGSKFARVRQATFMKFKDMDDTARAAEDLGVIWAANANAIPATVWYLVEILRDPSLETRVREEIQPLLSSAHNTLSHVPTFDINALCSIPLLQSIYAETLRLKVEVLSVRLTVVPSFQLNGWRFSKGNVLCASSVIESFDKSVWNTGGEGDPHPLEEFWADRFVVYPNDPSSGPLRKRKTRSIPFKSTDPKSEKSELGVHSAPRFSLEGLASSWIPYGGGVKLCPGRHFAKQEMITSAAIWLSAYDIELRTPPDFKFDVDKKNFGFGTVTPKDKIPVRIRRRKP